MTPMRCDALRRHWRRWSGTIAGRMVLGWGPAAVLVVIVGTVFSFLTVRGYAARLETERLGVEAQHAADHLASSLNRFVQLARRVAREPVVESTLLDSEGRERHIQPFIQLTALALGEEFIGGAQRPTLSVVDYRGRTVARADGDPQDSHAGSDWLDAVMGGQVVGRYEAGTGLALIAYPLHFPGTRKVEGAVVAQYDLAGHLRSRAREGLEIRLHPIGAAVRGADDGGWLVASAPGLRLAEPLDTLGLTVSVLARTDRIDRESHRLLVGHLLAGALLLLAVLVAAVRTAHSVTGPLAQLAGRASGWGSPGGRHERLPLPADAPQEVLTLAEQLDAAHTRLGERSERLRLLVRAMDSAREGIVILDAGPRAHPPTLYANHAMRAITGWTLDELLAQPLRFLGLEAPPQAGAAAVLSAISQGRACTAEFRSRRQDGQTYVCDFSLTPVRDEQGALTHFVGIQSDVTERRRTADQLAVAHKMDALGRLTGGLAHDFNNLLGIVIGNLDLLTLKAQALDERSREQVETALGAALRGAEVTRSLLAVARRRAPEPRVLDINAQIADLGPLIRNTVGATVEVDEDLASGPLPARLDADGFDSALLNLVINARDALPRGGRLRIATRRETLRPGDRRGPATLAPGDYAVLSVRDDGCGMRPEVLERAFEPFFTTKALGQGTGLGLAMVYAFAHQLAGGVAIDSAPGQGTEVRIYLRAERATPLPSPVARAALPLAVPRGRALVVDDEPELLQLAQGWLADLGFVAEGVGSADEAWRRLEQAPGGYTLLFSDIVMPGAADGIELARRASAADPALRVLLASGYTEHAGLADDLRWPLLHKPYRLADLSQALADLFDDALARPVAAPTPDTSPDRTLDLPPDPAPEAAARPPSLEALT